MSTKKYSGDDIHRILKAAAEQQKREHHLQENDTGLTLEELEQIASEAGIDPRFVRTAARGVPSGSTQRSVSRFYGGVKDLKITRSVQSPVSFEDAEAKLIPVIRESMQRHGSFERLGNTILWTDHTPAAHSSKITIASEKEETVVTAELSKQFKAGAYARLSIPFIILIATLGALSDNAMGPAAILLATFVAAFFLTRKAVSKWTSGKEAALRDTVVNLEEELLRMTFSNASESSVGDTIDVDAVSSEEKQPLLDLDNLPDEEEISLDVRRSQDSSKTKRTR